MFNLSLSPNYRINLSIMFELRTNWSI